MLAALLAALLATSLAIFSFGMHPARYVRLQRALGPGQGQIEPCTDRQAERVAERLQDKGVSSWRCKGWKQGGGAHERWHITSTDIHPASFPKLGRVISWDFRYAVAFHGFGREGILVGGAAPDSLKREVTGAIGRAVAGSGIAMRIAQPGDELGGSIPLNIVNRLTAGGTGGIQIEQGYAAREGYWQDIGDAVADVYDPKLAGDHPRAWHPPTKAPSGCTNFDEAASQTQVGIEDS